MSKTNLLNNTPRNLLEFHIQRANHYDGEAYGVFVGLSDYDVRQYYEDNQEILTIDLGIDSLNHWIGVINRYAERINEGQIKNNKFILSDGHKIDLSSLGGAYEYVAETAIIDVSEYGIACFGLCIVGGILLIGLIAGLSSAGCDGGGEPREPDPLPDECTPATETCDGADNDCDGETDEGFNVGGVCYADNEFGCPQESVFSCSDDGAGAVCRTGQVPDEELARPNECGVCGGPDVPPPGTECITESDCSAAGELVCNADGTQTCEPIETLEPNECGVCGGPDLPEAGNDCTDVNDSGCEENGVVGCNETGDGIECNLPNETEPNQCGVCDGPALPWVGLECDSENEHGCEEHGEIACDDDGTGTVCVVPGEKRPNECGLCGGPLLEDHHETCTATNGNGCPEEGVWQCIESGRALACNVPNIADTDNECGVCAPPLPAAGAACVGLNTHGCEEDGFIQRMCLTDGIAVDCIVTDETEQNNCGVCGGEHVELDRGCDVTGDDDCIRYGTTACAESGDEPDENGKVCRTSGSPVCPPADVNLDYARIEGTPVDMDVVGDRLVYVTNDTKVFGSVPLASDIDSHAGYGSVVELPDHVEFTEAGTVKRHSYTILSHIDIGANRSLVVFAGTGTGAMTSDGPDISMGWFTIDRTLAGETAIISTHVFPYYRFGQLNFFLRPTLGAMVSNDGEVDRLLITIGSIFAVIKPPGTVNPCNNESNCYESETGTVFAFPKCADGIFRRKCIDPGHTYNAEFTQTETLGTSSLTPLSASEAVVVNPHGASSIDFLNHTTGFGIDFERQIPVSSRRVVDTPEVAIDTENNIVYLGEVAEDGDEFHVVRVVDLASGEAGRIELRRPEGGSWIDGQIRDLTYMGGRIFISDTNGHVIIVNAADHEVTRQIEVGFNSGASAADPARGLFYQSVNGRIVVAE